MTEYTVSKTEPKVLASSNEVKEWFFEMSATDGDHTVSLGEKHIPENLSLRYFDYTPEMIKIEYEKWAEQGGVKSRLDAILAGEVNSLKEVTDFSNPIQGISV